ncbi:MAG: DNA-3-methyladenine glycosylase [Ignavibacteriaceae bacterium]
MNSEEIEKGIRQIYTKDKRLAPIIEVCGKCDLTPKRDYYHAILRAIIAQQLSTIVARVIIKRFMDFYNQKPLPERILNTPDEHLRNLGVSYAKIKYVKDLSNKIITGEVHFRGLNRKSDEDIIAEFTQVKGIGVWTVHMFLMFTLGRLNILPTGDLGIRRAVMQLYGLRKLPDEKKLVLISKKNGWTPYNSIASWYLWRSIDMKIVK